MSQIKKSSSSFWVIAIELAVAACVLFGGFQFLSGNSFLPILILLVVIGLLIRHLPKSKEEHPGQLKHLQVPGYRRRRAINWIIAGLAYAFLYWGRYNLNGAISALGGPNMVSDFHHIFSIGTLTYGLAFLLNGPLTDRFGGRLALITGVSGAGVINLLMGIMTMRYLNGALDHDQLLRAMTILFPINMYFQSFGAVAIVKINSPWFHVNERGVFGAIFGILISLGIYFAYDWTSLILKDWQLGVPTAFFAPAGALALALVMILLFVRNRPEQAGYKMVLTGDATSGDDSKPDHPLVVFRMMLGSKIIMAIAAIEFCSGFLRQAIMQNYPLFAKSVGFTDMFVYKNWGMMLCCAGILGGVFAGVISDHVFGSRRGPVAAVLYAGLLVTALGACMMLGSPTIGWIMIAGSLCVIGVHGMLSGTASMDFGGAKNAGIAVGLIDGFVYLGTAVQSGVYKRVLPSGGEQAADLNNWVMWPLAMIPFAVLGLVVAYFIRNAKPKTKKAKT